MRLPKAWQPCSLWQFLPGSRACAEAARAWQEAIRAAPRWQQEMQQGRPAASSGLRALGILCSTRLQGARLPAPELGAACCAPKLGALRGSCRGAHASCPLPAAPGGERGAGSGTGRGGTGTAGPQEGPRSRLQLLPSTAGLLGQTGCNEGSSGSQACCSPGWAPRGTGRDWSWDSEEVSGGAQACSAARLALCNAP